MKTYLFITNTNYHNNKVTGAHRRFIELINSIGRDNKVILVSTDKTPGFDNTNIERVYIQDKKYKLLPSHVNRLIIISAALRKLKKNIKYDYAVSFGPVDTVCYGLNGYKNIITLLREDFLGYKKALHISNIAMAYFAKMERYTIKRSAKIIVQCSDDKEALLSRYGKKFNDLKSKIYVQTNNINASWMLNKTTKTKAKNSDTINSIFVGNFSDNRKGHHLLLPAVRRLMDEGYSLRLLVVGDGKLLEEVKSDYKNCKGIVFLGRVNNVLDLIAESDFEVVPSLIDSCPNTVLEGLSVSTPVYGTNIGGIKELLQDKKYLFEPTVGAIYSFLKIILDKKQYISDAENQKSIKKRLSFDWGKAIEEIIENDNMEDQ